MRIGSMVSDVLRSFFKKPDTRPYPFERQEAPERFRGKLIYDPSKCTGCQLCVKDCTAEALELIVVDKASKRFVMRYHTDRCTYCDQCVLNCRFNCLDLEHDEWELAELTKAPFTMLYGRDEDVQAVLDKESARENAARPDAAREGAARE